MLRSSTRVLSRAVCAVDGPFTRSVAFPTKLQPVDVLHPESKMPAVPEPVTTDAYEPPSFDKLAVRWPNMPTAERDDVIAYLTDRQLYDWHYLSQDDRRALYYVCYGPWGPRDPNPPSSTGIQLLNLLGLTLGAGVVGVMGYCYTQDRKVLAQMEAAVDERK